MLKTFFLLQFRKNTGELFRLFFILFLAIFGFIFSDNIVKNADLIIKQEARELIGGDISLDGNTVFSEEIEKKVQEYRQIFGIKALRKLDLDTSIADKSGNPALVDVEFVDPSYPLVGDFQYREIDKSGDIYVDETLMRDFVVDDNLLISGKNYKVKGIILSSPGTGFSFFTEGRKVIIPYSFAESSGLLSLGARLDYEYIFLLPENSKAFLEQFEKDKELFSSYQIRDYASSVEQISGSITEFNLIVKLFFVFAFLISIICIFLTIESYITLEKKNFSLMIIFGLSKQKLLLLFFLFLFVLFHFAFGIAYISNVFSLNLLHLFPLTSDFVLFDSSLLLGYIVGFIILVLGSCYSFFSLFSLEVLEGLRPSRRFFSKRDIFIQSTIVGIGVFSFFIFSLGSSLNSLFVSLLFLGALLCFFFVFLAIFHFLYKVATRYRSRYFLLFDIVRFSVRPGNMTLIIVLPLFITLCLLFVFSAFSLTFLSKTASLDGGNDTFVINIPENLKTKIQEFIPGEEPFDVILGRIDSINSQTLSKHLGLENPSREFTREFNMTTHPLPKSVFLTGERPKGGEVSIDSDFSKRLKVELGDRITYNIYGKEKTFTVTSIRESKRDGFTPFFYFQFYKDDFLNVPRNFFIATRLTDISVSDLRKRIYEIGGTQINVIDLKSTLEKIETIFYTIIRFTSFLLVYLILYNFIILSVSLNFLRDMRKDVFRLYNIFGASKSFVKYHLMYEYVYLLGGASLFALLVGIGGYSFLVWKSSFIEFDALTLLKTLLIMLILLGGILVFISLQKLKNSKR